MSDTRPRRFVLRRGRVVPLAIAAVLCTVPPASSQRAPSGQEIFRFDTFGDEQLWTGILRMNEVIETSVSPVTALSVGLKVDAEAVPAGVLATADLNSPATTVELIRLNAVVGVVGLVEGGRLRQVGITCALCHSVVDDSVAPGIGRRLDGWPNLDLDPGAIIALSPALTAEQKAIYNSWGRGKYDPRYNIDRINAPVVIPPAYGLQGVGFETFTGDGPISYWNNYVAVTQMGGHGNFFDVRLDLDIRQEPDRVGPKLPQLMAYQLTLQTPAPDPGSFDPAAADRGRQLFAGQARCATCHQGGTYTDVRSGSGGDTPRLHAPEETGMDPLHASRSATRMYRTTPLRGLARHPPYFHDGRAPDLMAVVNHYDQGFGLGLSEQRKSDLVEFLKSL
jgi:mono/diheme cytochrome c family protein